MNHIFEKVACFRAKLLANPTKPFPSLCEAKSKMATKFWATQVLTGVHLARAADRLLVGVFNLMIIEGSCLPSKILFSEVLLRNRKQLIL